MKRERWRTIPNFEDHYQVSSLGRVRIVRRRLMRSNGLPYLVRGRVMMIHVNRAGARTVTLARCGRSVRVHVDVVAAKVFGHHHERKETRVTAAAS